MKQCCSGVGSKSKGSIGRSATTHMDDLIKLTGSSWMRGHKFRRFDVLEGGCYLAVDAYKLIKRLIK